MGGEIGGDGAEIGQQHRQCIAVPRRGDAKRALGPESGEPDRAAEIARHAAPGAVVMKDRSLDAPDPGGARDLAVHAFLAKLDIGRIAGAGGAVVGGKAAGLQNQGSGNGGAPDGLAGPGRDGFARAERLLRERLPDRVGEIASKMGKADHRVLGAVHAARQRRHQGDGGDDAHDLPGAETETPLAGGIEGAGHRVPDQQEPRQRQHACVEDEQHVAQHGMAPRADIAEERQHVPCRPVGIGEQAPVDRLRGRRFRQQHARKARAPINPEPASSAGMTRWEERRFLRDRLFARDKSVAGSSLPSLCPPSPLNHRAAPGAATLPSGRIARPKTAPRP